MQPLVSIIVPTYNRKDWLSEAIDSVLKQTYKNIEIIIIDDASTDGTIDLVHCINDTRIKYFRNLRNQGFNITRNLGISNASGEYLSFLDSDDRILPDKIQLLVNEALRTNSLMVYAGWRWMNFNNGKIRVERVPDKTGKIDGFPRWCYNIVPDLIKTTIVRDLQFRNTMDSFEHMEFLIRFFHYYQASYVTTIVSEFRDHTKDRVSNNEMNKFNGLKYILDHYHEFIKHEKKFVSNLYLSMAVMCHSLGYPSITTQSLFSNSIRCNPLNIRSYYHLMRYLLKI